MAIRRANPQATTEQVQDIIAFITAYWTVMPCELCADHFRPFIGESPFTEELAKDPTAADQWLQSLDATVAANIKQQKQKPQTTGGSKNRNTCGEASQVLGCCCRLPPPHPVTKETAEELPNLLR
jgi:hypothetical protein